MKEDRSGRQAILKPEPKNLHWINDMVEKDSCGEKHVMNPCARRRVAANTWMLLQRHLGIVRCDVDSSCFYQALSDVVGTFSM